MTYQHVLIIGIDGAGAGFRYADTPNMDRIFARGASTYLCQTAIPTISAECWGSLLIGVTPEVHKLTNDVICRASEVNVPKRCGLVEGTEYVRRPDEDKLPTIFALARRAMPDAKLAAFSNWTPINDGIIEQDIGVHFDCGGDQALTDKVAECMVTEKPTLFFVQYDSVDCVGHDTGYNNEIYYKKISEIDGYMGQIYTALENAGMAEDTLFIVTADHGGIERYHGGTSDYEKYVFFGAVGGNVAKKNLDWMYLRDIPAITCAALGIPGNEANWDSHVPAGFFND